MSEHIAAYSVDENNRFVIKNYNWAKSFSNFFPGIAGKWGIPIWCYYVNRNQGMCSLGVANKDHQIMEFLSFNKAVASVGKVGFRTYLKINDEKVYEPFQKTKNAKISQEMMVSSSELEIREKNEDIGIETGVTYYSLVGYKIPALVRETTIKNTSQSRISLELVDGLPHIFPYGVDISIIQTTPRHIEGMMKVDDYKGVPLYRLKQTPQDTEQVAKLEGGNFWFSVKKGDSKPLTKGLVVDPAILYGEAENYDYPWTFEERNLDQLLDQKQIRQNRTPSAFTTTKVELNPGEEVSLESFVGYTKTDEGLDVLLADLQKKDFLKNKKEENVELIEKIKHRSFTCTASTAFNEYAHQTFLDNVIRGGMPMTFDTAENKSAFYLYSRQNGDIERDYHYFVLEPTYLSQGTGHYRSILQNRRCDSWFFPEIEDYNIRLYMNLTQLDGFSPLEVMGTTYRAKNVEKAHAWLQSFVPKDKQELFQSMIAQKFTPGEFIMALEDQGVEVKKSNEDVLKELISFCEENEVGERLHLGFWIDHWCYNLDTIETYLMLSPDKTKELLIDKKDYSFYDNPDQVKPRDEKYVFANGKIHQYDAVVYDKEKAKFLDRRSSFNNRVRTEYGKGDIYQTNLCAKLLCHIANRIATLDPDNVGVEMEANKPGWNDSMSAIAGIFGSSLCHTFEIERASGMLLKALQALYADKAESLSVYDELAGLIRNLNTALEKRLSSQEVNKRLLYWDESHSLKEAYREKTKYGVKGSETNVSISEIEGFLKNCVSLIQELYKDENKHLAFNKEGIPYTYLTYEVPEYDFLFENKTKKLSMQGYPCVKPKSFKVKPIALFLEGPVHYLRVHPEKAKETCAAIKESNLYDKKLKMYKVCESLKDESYEIGRVHAWGSGWIENESIYTHMETKYLLELIKCGLYDEFYSAMQTGIPCFFDPHVYGRSIFENVSFIVSSAFVDEKMHGQGLQARLSGVTNEMIHVWVLMMAGQQPFYMNKNNELSFKLDPRLPEWLFSKEEKNITYYDAEDKLVEETVPKNSVACKLFGNLFTVYLNPERKNTYGKEGAKITSYQITYRDGSEEQISDSVMDSKIAGAIRGGEVVKIYAKLA